MYSQCSICEVPLFTAILKKQSGDKSTCFQQWHIYKDLKRTHEISYHMLRESMEAHQLYHMTKKGETEEHTDNIFISHEEASIANKLFTTEFLLLPERTTSADI